MAGCAIREIIAHPPAAAIVFLMPLIQVQRRNISCTTNSPEKLFRKVEEEEEFFSA